MRRDDPITSDACDTATVSLVAHEVAATRSYGRDEFELLAALREPVPTLVDTTRSRSRSRWTRGDAGAIAAGLATALVVSALGAYALAGAVDARASRDPSPNPTPREEDPNRQGAKAPEDQTSIPVAPWRLGGLSPNPSPTPTPTPAAVIDRLALGRYHDALLGYERLARAEPTRPVYAAAAAVLRHKLAVQCASRDGSPRAPCPVAEP